MKIFKLFTIIMLLFFGCNENTTKAEQLDENKHQLSNERIKLPLFEYKIKFPDTVVVNKAYDGEIFFKSPLDTITKKFFEKKEDRYVVFRTFFNNDYSMFEKFYDDSLSEYRFGAIDNRTIPFYDLSFNKKGEFYIKGLINDLILIELPEKDENGENLIRLIENNFPIEFKVIVIEDTDK